MPGSVTNAESAIPGLSLKAWALLSSSGALLRGSNVSSASRSTGGNYTLNLIQPLENSDFMYELRTNQAATQPVSAQPNGGTLAAPTFRTNVGTTDTQMQANFWIGILG